MPRRVDVHVGQRIRHRRWVLGMTQKQVAERLDVQFQQLQKYETGTNRISASRLWDLAQILDVPVAHFFEGADSHAAAREDISGDLSHDREAHSLLRVYYAVPEQHRRHLYDLAKVLGGASEPPQVA